MTTLKENITDHKEYFSTLMTHHKSRMGEYPKNHKLKSVHDAAHHAVSVAMDCTDYNPKYKDDSEDWEHEHYNKMIHHAKKASHHANEADRYAKDGKNTLSNIHSSKAHKHSNLVRDEYNMY